MPHLMETQLDAPAAACSSASSSRWACTSTWRRRRRRFSATAGHRPRVRGRHDARLRHGGRRCRHPTRTSSSPSAPGLPVERGIVVGDDLACAARPDVFAVGECAEHRGRVYGLVAPLWEQAQVLADRLTRPESERVYAGSKLSTKLKVAGVDLAVMGDKDAVEEDDEVVSYAEPARGIYKKLVVRNGRLAGAIVIGDGGIVPVAAPGVRGMRRCCRRTAPSCCFRCRRRATLPPAAEADPRHGADLQLQRRLQGADRRSGAGRRAQHAGGLRRDAGVDRLRLVPAEVQAIVELACQGLAEPRLLAAAAVPRTRRTLVRRRNDGQSSSR